MMRGRAGRRGAVHERSSFYSDALQRLLALEREEERKRVLEILAHANLGQLEREGLIVLGLTGTVRGYLFGEKVIRLGFSGGKPLPFHRFTPGDVVALTPGTESPFPNVLNDEDNEHPSFLSEGVVIEHGGRFVDVIFRDPPAWVSNSDDKKQKKTRQRGVPASISSRDSANGVTGSFRTESRTDPPTSRLSLYFSDVSFLRQEVAVAGLSSPDNTRDSLLCPDLRTCLVDSFFVEAGAQDKERSGAEDAHKGAARADRAREGVASRVEREGYGGAPTPQALARASPPWKPTRGQASKAVKEVEEAAVHDRPAVADSEPLPPSSSSSPLLVDAPQRVAVVQALQRRLALIQGPPGTGKTRTACVLTAASVALAKKGAVSHASSPSSSSRRAAPLPHDRRVLACAFSNVGADNLLDGLLALNDKVVRRPHHRNTNTSSGGSSSRSGGSVALDVVRVGSPASVRPDLRNYTLDAWVARDPAVLKARATVEKVSADLARARRTPEELGATRGGAGSFQGLGEARGEVQRAIAALGRAETKAVAKRLRRADVVVSTCVGAGSEALRSVVDPETAPRAPAPTTAATTTTRSKDGNNQRENASRSAPKKPTKSKKNKKAATAAATTSRQQQKRAAVARVGTARGKEERSRRRGGKSGNGVGAPGQPSGPYPWAAPLLADGGPALRFATVLIDEAAQATEPACLVPLGLGCRQLFLVGDHCQLPPTVISQEASRLGLNRSLFARLLLAADPVDAARPSPRADAAAAAKEKAANKQANSARVPVATATLLSNQYRMHPALARFSSDRFYGGRVASVPTPSERPTPSGFAWPRAGSAPSNRDGATKAPALAKPRAQDGGLEGGRGSPRRRARGLFGLAEGEVSPVAFVAVQAQSGKGLESRAAASGGDRSLNAKRLASREGERSRTEGEGDDEGGEAREVDAAATSFCNEAEAARVVDIVLGLLRGSEHTQKPGNEASSVGPGPRLRPSDIGVVTPYAAQARLITSMLGGGSGAEARNEPRGSLREAAGAVEVSSVDGYQGREKEVVVVSTVRSNAKGAVGFVRDWRRLNVAVTRARSGMVVVGDPSTLVRGCPDWMEYIEWHREAGTIIDSTQLPSL